MLDGVQNNYATIMLGGSRLWLAIHQRPLLAREAASAGIVWWPGGLARVVLLFCDLSQPRLRWASPSETDLAGG